MKSIKLKKTLALIAFVALCGVVFAVGVTAIVKSMQFTIGVKYNPPYKIAVDVKMGDTYVNIFDVNTGGAISSASKYVDAITSDTIALNNEFLAPDVNGNLYFNLTNQEPNKTLVFVLVSGLERLEIIIPANQTVSAQALNVGDMTNGGLIKIRAYEQEVQSMGFTTSAEIEFNYNEISTKEAFEASEYFTNLEITETYNFGESQTFNLAQNLDRYEISYSTTDFENADEVTLTITNKANSELAPITKTILIKHFDFVATFSTDELDVVSATSSLEGFFNEDFSISLEAPEMSHNAGRVNAFVFDITLKDSASNVLASTIASETIINYDWEKQNVDDHFGTLTIPAQYLTNDVASVEIYARAGYTWSGMYDAEIGTSGTISITNPLELAVLASNVNGSEGTSYTYSGATINLQNHLYLNDEIFLNLGNGYVKVTDGVNVAYLGDGSGRIIDGTYTTLTTAGQWYSNTSGTTGSYTGDLNEWTPIGTSYANRFRGTFDGGNYEISGMYINTTSDYQGLFGYASDATIQNLGVVNGYVKGGDYVGGICGDAYNTIQGCTNSGTVSGSGTVGGICGGGITISNCNNFGAVSGSSYVGGICGDGIGPARITNCINSGSITATSDNVGGICGYSANMGNYIEFNSCKNLGCVTGIGNSIGGICGYAGVKQGGAKFNSCENFGCVRGMGNYVGGISGQAKYSTFNDTHNNGAVSGNSYIGGICGSLENTGESKDAHIIGCSNTGEISATSVDGEKDNICPVYTKGSVGF